MVVIEANPGKGLYNSSNMRALLDAVAVEINKNPQNVVVRGPLDLISSQDHYRFASLAALAAYMMNFAKPQPLPNVPLPGKQFDNHHGPLHFGGNPTKQKSKWDLLQPAALTLMQTEIDQHVGRLRRDAQSGNAWEPWYIGTQAANNIGRYEEGGVRGGKPTDLYTIQLQVHWADNVVSYHGFPDEKLAQRHLGCGRAKNQLNCNC